MNPMGSLEYRQSKRNITLYTHVLVIVLFFKGNFDKLDGKAHDCGEGDFMLHLIHDSILSGI